MTNHPNPSSLGGTIRPSNPPTRDVNAVQRVTLALQLRARKMGYEAIAAQTGYSNASAARKAIMRELDRCVYKGVDAMRTEELDSLERLEFECWKRLSDKDYAKSMLFAVDRIVAIKERRAKLMGLDIPTKDAANPNMVVVREIPSNYLAAVEAAHE